MKLQIRQVNKKDIDKIVPIMFEVAKLHKEGRREIFKEKTEKEIKKEIIQAMLNKDSNIIVASDEKKNVYGVVIYKFKTIENHNNLKNAKILWIEELGIKKEFQKQGIGKLLMQKVKEIAKEEKCHRLELNCWKFNQNAIEFYKKIGMQEQRINMEMKL